MAHLFVFSATRIIASLKRMREQHSIDRQVRANRPASQADPDWNAFIARLRSLHQGPGSSATRLRQAVDLVCKLFESGPRLASDNALEAEAAARQSRASRWDDPKVAAQLLLDNSAFLSGEPFLAHARAQREAYEAAARALEAEWDPAKHPRGGKNPGWFSGKTGDGEARRKRSAPNATAKVQSVAYLQKKPSQPAAQPGNPPPAQPKPNAPAPDATIPKGTKDNGYQGLGSWEFASEDDAYKFFEDLLPADERPPGWKAKVALGCVGLNSLRCGDPSGRMISKPFQNVFMRKDAETFKSKDAAEKRLAELQKNNPGQTYYLAAMQIKATDAGGKKFNALGDGPFRPSDLSGIIDPVNFGAFNFATRLALPNGKVCWEWMNHGLHVEDSGPSLVRHNEDLPKNYDATFYVVVKKESWK